MNPPSISPSCSARRRRPTNGEAAGVEMVPRAHGDEPYSDSQHRADSEEAPSGRGWTITGHHQRRLVGGSPVRMGLPPGVDCGGDRGYRRCCADPMAGLANAGTMGLTSRRGHGGGAAVVVSGPDVGAGHPGGWLGPSQGWISPPSRRAVAGWEAWHGSDGAPGRPIYPLPAARRSTESRFYRPFHPFTVGGPYAAGNGSPGPGLRAGRPCGLIVPGEWRF